MHSTKNNEETTDKILDWCEMFHCWIKIHVLYSAFKGCHGTITSVIGHESGKFRHISWSQFSAFLKNL